MSTFLKQWIIKAENDLTTAKHELELPKDQTITDSVCFHSQQAVEKFLKIKISEGLTTLNFYFNYAANMMSHLLNVNLEI